MNELRPKPSTPGKTSCLRGILTNEWMPFVALFVVILAIHFNMTVGLADDAIYAAVLGEKSLWEFSKTNYYTWSSRQLIEGVLIYIIHYPLLWRVLDSLMITLTARWIYRATGPSDRGNAPGWIICALCAMYPMAHLISAGWVVTTLNYIWPLALGMYNISLVFRLTRAERVRAWEYPLGLLATLFAANMEQMAVGLFIIDGVLLGWNLVRKKKASAFLYGAFAIVLIDILYSRTCPGAAERLINETNGWFPEFGAVPLWRKLEMGFSSTIRDFAMYPNLTFWLFAVLLLCAVWIRTSKTSARACASAPLFVALFFGVLGNDPNRPFNGLCAVVESIGQYGTAIRFSNVASWAPDIVMVGLVLAILYALWHAFDSLQERLGAILALTAGFGTRMVMSLSPTIWASGDRTYCYLYFSFFAVCALLAERTILPSRSRLRQPVFILMGALSLAALINTLALAL